VFPVDEGVPAVWKNTKDGFELLLKGITFADLGAPLGDEGRWVSQFVGLRDSRVEAIRLQELAEGVSITGKWKFPKGTLAPAFPIMEAFEYRDKAPQYLVDFWYKKGPTLAEYKAKREEQGRLLAEKKEADAKNKKYQRQLASVKAKSDSESLTDGFCAEPLGPKTDVFLQFLPVHEAFDFSKWFAIRAPDENYDYYKPTAQSREAQYIRLALELNRQGNPALVVRTIDFFQKEFPTSPQRNDMRFLKASALVRLGLTREAEAILSLLMNEAQDSPVALYSGMYMAGSQLQSGSSLAALETFLWLIKKFPENKMNWVFHMGVAETLFALKQTERSAKEYQWVVENAPTPQAGAEGAARLGDIYLDRFQYERGLAAYFQGLKHFKQEIQKFPSLFINRAEALYQLGEMDRAKEAFEDFLTRYPSHPSGWRAAFRLGEVEGRKPGAEATKASRNWFHETINRYPTSPGAVLARLRLIPCHDQGGFDAKGIARFMTDEAEKFDGRGEVNLARYRDFRGIAFVRAMMTVGKDDEAVEMALQQIKSETSIETRPFLNRIVSALFRKAILRMLDQGKQVEAVAFYQQKKDLIIRGTSIGDMDYLVRLSRTASDLGLASLGKELAETYAAALRDYSGPERAPAGVSSEQELDLAAQLRISESSFAQARALWVDAAARKEPAVRDQIRSLLSKVRDESPFSFDREVLFGLIEEADGKMAKALTHVSRAQALKRKPESEQDLRLEAWVANLQANAGDSSVALSLWKNVERRIQLNAEMAKRKPAAFVQEDTSGNSLSALGVAAAPSLQECLFSIAEIHSKAARWGEAAATYSAMVEKGLGGSRAVYGFGNALVKTGEQTKVKQGRSVLAKLADNGPGEKFWKSLAAKALIEKPTEHKQSENLSNAKEGGK